MTNLGISHPWQVCQIPQTCQNWGGWRCFCDVPFQFSPLAAFPPSSLVIDRPGGKEEIAKIG